MKKLMKAVSGMLVAMMGMAPVVCRADLIDPFAIEEIQTAIRRLVVIGIAVIVVVVVAIIILVKCKKNKKNKDNSEE